MTFQSWLEDALAEYGESWADVTAHTLAADELAGDAPSDDSEKRFTVWTTTRVYFPNNYDWVAYAVVSVPRNPSTEECLVS